MQRCIGVDGAGHKADGYTCGALVEGPRCPPCARTVEAARTRGKRERRPYTAAERERRARAVQAWVDANGWLCPGWQRPPHPVPPGYLTAEHTHAVASGGDEAQPLDVLCRSCNSAHGSRSVTDAQPWGGGYESPFYQVWP